MAEIPQLAFRIAVGMLKHYAKKVVGDDVVGVVADTLLDHGERAGAERLDEWLKAPAAQKELRRAINRTERCFADSNADEKIRKVIVSTGLAADAGLIKAIEKLPNDADDDGVRTVLVRSVQQAVPEASPQAVAGAVDEYLRCLRRGMLTLKDKGPAIVGQAVLRIESSLERVEETTRCTEQKLDAFIVESRKRVDSAVGGHIIDFSAYINDKTENFVGRTFVFEALDEYLRNSASGYFIVRGDPGIGKSALMATLVAGRGYAHHFNIAAEGIVTHRQFYTNAAAQIISRFGLDHHFLPERAGEDASFLKEVLTEAVAVSAGAKVVLAVDALDEAEAPKDSRTNPLRLPKSLPRGAFVVASTRRREEGVELDVESFSVLELDALSKGNLEDIVRYIEQFAKRPGMKSRLDEWKMSFEAFVLKLKELSEGNFMYLRHVLPAIELGSFREGGVDELPRGLLGYYRQHWEQMRGDDAATFARNKKVIAVLATARQPASPAFVSRITGLSLEDVQWTLEKWREFLHPSSTDGELRFRIYHASYRDFLARQAGG